MAGRVLHKIIVVVCGILIFFLLLELGLRLGGFVFASIQEYRNLCAVSKTGACRIMCIGESTTRGQYPSFLEERLNAVNSGIHFVVIDRGAVGVDSSFLVSRLKADLDWYRPNIVVAMMGCNDAGVMYYKDIPRSNTLAFRYSRVYRLVWILMTQIDARLKEWGRSPAEKFMEEGRRYLGEDDLAASEEAFRKAVAESPRDIGARLQLALVCQIRRENLEARAVLMSAFRIDPKNSLVYSEFGRLYLAEKKISRAKHAFRQAIALDPGNLMACRSLSTLYLEEGKAGLAHVYAQRARSMRRQSYIPLTVDNFHRMKSMLDQRGIRLVCVQYPMRDIEPLKEIFKYQDGGIVFVDNEKVFRDAVSRDGYKEYFWDMFGGDFGHCTKKGNRLLARNIAGAILDTLFNKQADAAVSGGGLGKGRAAGPRRGGV